MNKLLGKLVADFVVVAVVVLGLALTSIIVGLTVKGALAVWGSIL